MDNLIILQTAAPDYRKKFFTEVSKTYDGHFTLFAGDDYFAESVKTDSSIPNLKKLSNHYFFGRKILFQTGMWREVIFAKHLVMEMNPRILSSWILLILRKVLLKKTVLWGHAWPASGKGSKSDKIRNFMRRLGDAIICYTKTQAQDLREYMPNKKISYASNSLYYKNEMSASLDNVGNDLIYVGRLTAPKKPQLAVRAFHSIIKDLPKDSNLVLVGDGEESNKLQDLVKELNLEGRVKLLGHIGDYSELKNLYSQAVASISSGYVGLSITQSFGFGVPMIISRDEKHSPEIECAIEGENAVFFNTDSVEDLGKKMLSVIKNKKMWIEKRPEIQKFCQDNYSIEKMAEGFLEAVK